MIAIANRNRRNTILLWTPKKITQENGHFSMFDDNQIFQDTLGQIPGSFNQPVSIVKNISGNHEISTKVFEILYQ